MDLKRALRLAIACIEDSVQRLAVSANLHDQYGADFPSAVNASRQRAALREAVGVLKQMIEKPKATQEKLFDKEEL